VSISNKAKVGIENAIVGFIHAEASEGSALGMRGHRIC